MTSMTAFGGSKGPTTHSLINGRVLSRVAIYALLIVFAVFFLLPVYMVLMTGFKSVDQVSISRMWELPTSFTLESFQAAFRVLAPGLGNSIMLVVPATILSAVLGSLNGYVLSKWKFRGSNLLFTLMLFGMFIPYQAILIPLVQFLSPMIQSFNSICLGTSAGFLNFSPNTSCTIYIPGNLIALIIVHVVYGLPITTLIFRNYYSEVPDEMIEAGAIDGAGFFGLYRYIVLPISLPGFVVVVIWQFTQIWNEFLFAVSLAQNTPTVTVALQNLSGSQIIQWNVQMAAAFLAAIPTLVVYIILGRYFIRGLLAGSVKG